MACFTLSGGSPWGFKMMGGKDFHFPLTVVKVVAQGKAHKSGVPEGYIIEKINGEDVTNMPHHEALNRIKCAGYCLTLYLSKPKSKEVLAEHKSSANSYKSHKTKPETSYVGLKYWEHTQSPSMYTKTLPANEDSSLAREKLIISRELKKRIIDDEFNEAQQQSRASEIKVWQPEAQRPQGLSSSSNSRHHQGSSPNEEKHKAATNIGNYFRSPSAPRHGKPYFAKTLCDLISPLGEPVVLEIRLGSVLSVPTVHWYHDNKPARESLEEDIRILSNGPVHTLVLGELTPHLTGSYTCTIANEHGSVSSSCRVAASTEHSSESHYDTTRPPSKVLRHVVAKHGIEPPVSPSQHNQFEGQTRRCDFQDSEVMRAMKEETPLRHHYKTPSMKHLEKILLGESDDL